MADREERIDRLEGDLVDLKTDTKNLLIELKVLMSQNHNPLTDQTTENQPQARNVQVIVVAPTNAI